jgi:hypothetical protein
MIYQLQESLIDEVHHLRLAFSFAHFLSRRLAHPAKISINNLTYRKNNFTSVLKTNKGVTFGTPESGATSLIILGSVFRNEPQSMVATCFLGLGDFTTKQVLRCSM